jgi:hypothetical protein
MKLTRTVITILLLLFVGATVGTLIAQEVARPESSATESSTFELPVETNVSDASETANSEPDPVLEDVVGDPALSELDASASSGLVEGSVESLVLPPPSTDVLCVIEATYFHNTNRCVTCLKIEGDAKAIVEQEFAEELAAGRLRWSTINMEEERAAISQYDLVAPSLVLIRKVGDEVVEWITLEETWALVRSTTRYTAYIIDSFETFLKGCP